MCVHVCVWVHVSLCVCVRRGRDVCARAAQPKGGKVRVCACVCNWYVRTNLRGEWCVCVCECVCMTGIYVCV